jgi:hypothetical protein
VNPTYCSSRLCDFSQIFYPNTPNFALGVFMNNKWAIAAVALSYSVLLVVGLFAFQTLYEPSYQSQIDRLNQLNKQQTQRYIAQFPGVNVTMFHQDTPLYQSPNKPNIITPGVYAQDVRIESSPIGPFHALRVMGRLNNTGGGTAYNLAINVLAMNSQGVAINSNHTLGGITPHMSLGFNYLVNYTGSAITNCTITLLYTDFPQPLPTPLSSSFFQ